MKTVFVSLLALSLILPAPGISQAFAQSHYYCPGPEPEPEPEPQPPRRRHGEHSDRHLGPIFHLDFGIGQKMINLSSNAGQPGHEQDPDQGALRPDKTLVMHDYSRGFRVVRRLNYKLGVGIKSEWFFKHASGVTDFLKGYVGLMPLGGKDVLSSQFVHSYEELEKLPSVYSRPSAEELLLNWHIGDSLVYQSTGGILFLVGGGIGPAGLTIPMTTEGIWRTVIEKVDANTVLVYIAPNDSSAPSHVRSISIVAHVPVLSVGPTAEKMVEEGFSFAMDLRSPTAKLAYEDLLSGNIAGVAELASAGNAGVQEVDRRKLERMSRSLGLHFGLPFVLNLNWRSGRIEQWSQVHNIKDGAKSTVDYGMFQNQEVTTVLFKQKIYRETFYGAAHERTLKDSNTIEQGEFAEYVWQYQDEDSSSNDLREALSYLAQKTGVAEIVNVNVPSGVSTYAEVEFKVHYPESSLKRLMKIALNNAQEDFVSVGLIPTHQILGQSDETLTNLGICQRGDAVDQRAGSCERRYEVKTRLALQQMWEQLREMSTFKAQDRKAHVKAVAAVGKAAIQNPLTFQTLMAMAGPGVEIDFLVRGAEFSQYRVRLVSDGEGWRYRPVRGEKFRSGLESRVEAFGLPGVTFDLRGLVIQAP